MGISTGKPLLDAVYIPNMASQALLQFGRLIAQVALVGSVVRVCSLMILKV